jgi:hypothetical protein
MFTFLQKISPPILSAAVIFSLIFFFLPPVTFAQTEELKQFGKEAYGESATYQETAGPVAIAGKIINIFLGLVGIIMVILFVYGGFLWMTAAGNEERITKAKTVLSRATIGFIILILAYSISYFVMQQVLKASGAPMTP